MKSNEYPGFGLFPLGSAWEARDTPLNEAQDIPGGSTYRIVFGCESFFSLYSESLSVDNLKVPRTVFGSNFQRVHWRPDLTAGFPAEHYPKKYKTFIRNPET
ncbi:MAG: hypothetical protein CVT70_16955 [Alphaproteobacteria bacterium HGW-Alphaproteobacteria-1]|jgi:hypothetical protein|nr:MAG: hypothetical protein CVT70_16955 [Alphaproteobacteria bacterium HGW-Alphaproteobacteria-1]